ncbi:hypothetical protein BV22DRAFT_1041041 [Leucogyrophana mollusca]|uniref:Uncharacterized protein n=1 Tax=Leucogyrophana mollusca TaxID=85980 RepID=A0ACB8B2J3_9AGAM|nr:hypothetical protein BV22DRAFT_1041041 [Leucogyrophana mollusca]
MTAFRRSIQRAPMLCLLASSTRLLDHAQFGAVMALGMKQSSSAFNRSSDPPAIISPPHIPQQTVVFGAQTSLEARG